MSTDDLDAALDRLTRDQLRALVRYLWAQLPEICRQRVTRFVTRSWRDSPLRWRATLQPALPTTEHES